MDPESLGLNFGLGTHPRYVMIDLCFMPNRILRRVTNAEDNQGKKDLAPPAAPKTPP